MKAHRLIMIGLIATSLLAGCKKENNKPTSHLNMDGISFNASIENHNGNAKTYLEGVDVKWMASDKILVTNSSSQQGEFEVTSGANTTSAIFYTAGDFAEAPDYNAAYPFSIASINGTTATFNMTGTQTITTTGTFANGAMPMVAHSSNETLNFRNVLGGLGLPIKGAGISVTKIVLTSNNANEMLWGTFNADCTSATPNPTNISGGSNVLELVCDPAVELQGAQSQEFVFMIPEGTLQSGFTFDVYSTGADPVYSKTVNFTDGTFSPSENLINRSMIREVNADINIEVALQVQTYSPTFISYDKAWVGGTVTGGTPTDRGVIYATKDALGGNADNLVMGGTGVTSLEITGGNTSYNDWANSLAKNTIYYVRAYANSASGETYYGDAIPFATRRDYEHDYQGKLQGGFSIASGDQRYFAMGNLQYKAIDATWYYADYQFEFVGWYRAPGNVYEGGEQPIASNNGLQSDNTKIERFSNPNDIDTEEEVNLSNNSYNTSYQGRVDWFTWGSSGYNHSSAPTTPFYQPYCRLKRYTATPTYVGQPYPYFNNNYAPYDSHYYIGGNADTDLSVENRADWAYNTIQNGSAAGKRTISADNWNYLLYTRNASTVNGISNARFSFAILNVRNNKEVNGIFLFPDNFTWPEEFVTHYPSYINNNTVSEWTQIDRFTEAEWSLLERANLVFLPCSGCYGKTGYAEWSNRGGRYWTSTGLAATSTLGSGAYDFAFSPEHQHGEGIVNAYARDCRFYGFAVRFMIP